MNRLRSRWVPRVMAIAVLTTGSALLCPSAISVENPCVVHVSFAEFPSYVPGEKFALRRTSQTSAF